MVGEDGSGGSGRRIKDGGYWPKEAPNIYKRDRVMHVISRASGDQQTEK